MAVDRRHMELRIRGWLLSGDKAGDACKAISLCHLRSGASSPVETWLVATDTDPKELLETILDTAEGDARGIGKEQQYCLFAYFGEAKVGSAAYSSRLPFTINAPAHMDPDGEMTVLSSEVVESPKDLLALSSKMMLEHHRLTVPWANELMRAQQRTITEQRTEIENLRKDHRKAVVLQEKLLSRHTDRQIKIRRFLMWEKKKEEIAGIIMPLLAPIFMGIAGKHLGPAQPTKESATFEQFIQALQADPEKLPKLMDILKPQQKPSVMAMAGTVMQGGRIAPVMLKGFIESLDEPQLDAMKEILTEEQWTLFYSAMRSLYEQWAKTEAEVKKARRDVRKAAANTDPEVDDDILEGNEDLDDEGGEDDTEEI